MDDDYADKRRAEIEAWLEQAMKMDEELGYLCYSIDAVEAML